MKIEEDVLAMRTRGSTHGQEAFAWLVMTFQICDATSKLYSWLGKHAVEDQL